MSPDEAGGILSSMVLPYGRSWSRACLSAGRDPSLSPAHLVEARTREARAGPDRGGIAQRRVAQLEAALEQALRLGAVAGGGRAGGELEPEVGVVGQPLQRDAEQPARRLQAA